MEVRQWSQIRDELEIKKAMKKMRMLYGHLTMWEEKMREVYQTDEPRVDPNDPRWIKTNVIDDPLPRPDINRKRDEDFVYF